jgi:hypothetical protein
MYLTIPKRTIMVESLAGHLFPTETGLRSHDGGTRTLLGLWQHEDSEREEVLKPVCISEVG